MINGLNFTYHGKVNIRVGKKRYHAANNGTSHLFELFARFLVGESISQSELPGFIDIQDSQSDTILNSLITISKEYRNNETPSTVITAVISDSNLSSLKKPFDSSYNLILYDRLAANKLAIVSIEKTVLDQITTGRQALIEWSLYVTNEEADK